MIRKCLYRVVEFLYKGLNKVLITPGIKQGFGRCGKNVRVAFGCDFKPTKNIFVGDNSQIGARSLFWTTRAKIVIGNKVLMGPGVTIITGDHRTDIIGKHIIDVTDAEKLPKHDADVIIEDGVWIGCNVTILKGVHIGTGAVVAAGALVVKDVEPYAIVGGVPAKKINMRFTDSQIKEHEAILGIDRKS